MQPITVALGLTVTILALTVLLASPQFAYLAPHTRVLLSQYWPALTSLPAPTDRRTLLISAPFSSGLMSVFSNVIKPQGLEPLQFPTGSSHKCVHDSAPAGRPRRGKRVRMRSCQLTSGEVVCRSVDGRLRGPRF